MNRIMVDIETMGLPPDGLILSIGAVRFDGRGILDRFDMGIDGIWWAVTIATVLGAVFHVIWFQLGRWKKFQV